MADEAVAEIEIPADTVADASAAATDNGEAAGEAPTGPEAIPAAPEAQTENEGGTAPEVEYPDDDGGEEGGEEAAPVTASAAGEDPTPPSAAAQRYGTAALTRILKEQPELAQAAENNPRVKAQLYQMARRSQELADYQEVMPSLKRAREAAEAQSALAGYDEKFFGEEPEQFWQTLYDAQLSPEGRSSGTYERHVQFLEQTFLDGLADRAQRAGNTGLSEAVDAIRESLGWGHSRNTPHSPAQDGSNARSEAELNPQIRQKLQTGEEAARELQQLRSRLSAAEQQEQERYWEETAAMGGREVRSFVDGILANAKLSEYDKNNIARDFIEEVTRLSGEDKVLGAALSDLLGTRTPEAQQRAVARIKAWTRQNGRDILEPILRRAGASLKQRQAERDARQATAARRHREPASSGAPADPTQLTARDLVKQAESKIGRHLTDREILDLA